MEKYDAELDVMLQFTLNDEDIKTFNSECSLHKNATFEKALTVYMQNIWMKCEFF